MKKLLCLLAVLLTLMGVMVVDLFWGGDVGADEVELSESKSSPRASRSNHELQRIIRRSHDS